MSESLGVSLFRPEGKLKAVVQIVHGMSEHRKRYEDFAEFLKSHGYGVVTFDLPGHGESAEGGLKGYFGEKGGWDHLLYATHQVTEQIKKECPGVPIVLFGHSMGSIIGRCYIQQYDDELAGTILSGVPNYQPAAKLGQTLGNFIKRFKGGKGYSRLMDYLVTGTFNKAVKNPKTPFDWISYNEENVSKYAKDSNCGFPFTIQGYIDELEGVVRMHEVSLYKGKHKEMPLFVFAGEDDPCRGGDAGFEDTINTLKQAGYKDITTKLYANMRHEVLNEKDHMVVYEDVLNWLEEKIH